jgi:uncharacterized protein YyaL (SSP411 family)
MASQKPLFTNRLATEKSPYLLQHAHNPVDWYPWSEEAFTAAKVQDKPIFLSIGYSTCHWCHVMEHESFASVQIAELMNATFINIKVDREELPEIDALYMEFAQAMMAGGAGWPLNLILTPDLKPFFAATYLPADSQHGFLGMKQLISRIAQIWQEAEERELVIAQAGKIVDLFEDHVHVSGDEMPAKEKISEASDLLYKTADPIYGGTKGAPKFPIGFQACFLLKVAKATKESRALFYVERTLEMMYRGGIYDHVGGGFSRYSVDEKWMIPHFEKMLYDNAILARAYVETWEYTKENFYREVCEDILSYILKEMRGKEGGFYSAEDADSEEYEGRFYIWSWEEVRAILGPDSTLFCEFYSVTPPGNFQGKNILHMKQSLNEFATSHRLDPVVLGSILKECRHKLNQEREKRERPLKDDKIITSYNGLMITALVEAFRAFHNEKYLEPAVAAARFIKENLWKDGMLYRRWRDAEARFEGCLDDYAAMIQASISLFEADCGTEWLQFALELDSVLNSEFKAEKGAFYFTNGTDPNLLLRTCEFYDGAEPSGNALQAENYMRLYQITGDKEYLTHVEEILKAAKQHIDMYPPGACYHLMVLQRYYDSHAPSIIIALNSDEEHREELVKMLSGRFIPNKVVVWKRESDEELRDLAPITRDKMPLNGKTTLYICHQNQCQEPLTDFSKMWEEIEKL